MTIARRAACPAFLSLALLAAPAAAGTIAVDLPAGPLGRQVMALGRSARISIAVPDASLWVRPMPALRGRMPVSGALARIARRAGATVTALGPSSWRLTSAPTRRPPAGAPRSTTAVPPPSLSPGPDIVVVASKRDTPYRDFAGQVSRVDGTTLELGGAGGTERLATRLTSVASTYLGAGRNKLFIRGIADSSFTGPTQATVGQYFGDLRLSYNAPDPDLQLVDLSAVEVLEGPQGTLYGAGSLGGLIRLVPKAPDTERTEGSVAIGGSATAHGAPGADARAIANVPLVEGRLAIRLVATATSEGGYIDKPALGRDDANRTRAESIRAAARLAIAPGWTADLIGIGQRIRAADSQYADRDGGRLSRAAPVAEGFGADFRHAQFVLSGRIGEVSLRSTSGVTAHDLTERYDATMPGDPARLFVQRNRTRMIANESRAWASAADGSGWLAGISYLRNRTRLTRLLGEPGAALPTAGVLNGIAETTLYGEGSVRLLPGLLATGGLRLTRSVLSGEGENVASIVPVAELSVSARRGQVVALPAASALIDLTRDAALFLRYQQGFRPGGLAIEQDFVRRFRNDRVATIESGLRLGAAGRTPLDLSLTVARTSWRDIQADFIDGLGLPSTANIGDGRIWSVETTGGARIVEGLRVEGALTWNSSRIDEPSRGLVAALAQSEGTSVEDARALLWARLRQIPNIARVTARLGTVYRRRLGALRRHLAPRRRSDPRAEAGQLPGFGHRRQVRRRSARHDRGGDQPHRHARQPLRTGHALRRRTGSGDAAPPAHDTAGAGCEILRRASKETARRLRLRCKPSFRRGRHERT